VAEYVCKVADTSGRVFQQVETAQSQEEVRQKLVERGLYVYSVRTHFDPLAYFSRARRDSEIRINDFLIFNQQFNTLIKAGLPILKALDLLTERAAAPRIRPILSDVRQRVRDGALLSFPPIYVTAITAGERSGNLTGVLEQYISYLRVSTGFRSRLITTLIYPFILLIAVVLSISYLVTFAMPRFADLYKDLGVPLPTITRVMLAISAPLRDYYLIAAAAIVVLVLAALAWSKSDRGALALDSLKPKLPIFGDIWLKAQIAQFVRTLATLLAGGTPLVSGLQTSASALGSKMISDSVIKATARVREGESLHASLAEARIVPPLALEMIEVGEASGALAPMLISIAEFYEDEVNTRLQRALIWIQPALLAVVAVVVGFVLISLYLPLFSMGAGAGG
jgi:type IV pilus assembly protein PilC